MKKLVVIGLMCVAACSERDDANGAAASAPAAPGTATPAPQQRPGAAITSLTGLYEGQGPGRTNQLCMVDPKGETARFGLVAWGAGENSCSGSGTAERRGAQLQLRMTGDETCTIDARIEGAAIVLPDSVPSGCAYYCGPQARLSGQRFTQTGAGRADAAKAKDLVGDPLC